MAVTTAFYGHLRKHFRKCYSSHQTLLHISLSSRTYMTASALSDKYSSMNFLRMFRICKLELQPKVVNILSYKWKHTYSHHNPSYQNLSACSSYYSELLTRVDRPYTLHCAYLNSTFEFPRGLNDVIIRSYHDSSKFTIKNPVYSSYLDSLAEEYDTLTTTNQHDNSSTEIQQQQLLRSNFLRPVLEFIKILHMKNSEIQELVAVLNEESDQEMKKMIEKEIEKCNKALEELENELIAVLVGEDLANHSDVVLEVTAGVGGQEAMLFAAEILSMYRNYAYYKGWTITGLTDDTSDIGGTRKATIEINGQDVYKHLKFEAGVHRVQRIPKTEKAGRIHTSTISVSVLPQPKEVDIEICQEDLKIDTFRSSGPGGQSVNTTDSAVRITHIPTGTVAESRQERSQIKNKDIAMKRLKNSIYQAVIEEQETKRRAARKMQMGSRGRSEKIRTYNFQQDRITDHRLKENCSDLTTFMTGREKLDDFINSLADLDKVHSLESMLDEYEAEIKRKKSGNVDYLKMFCYTSKLDVIALLVVEVYEPGLSGQSAFIRVYAR